MQQLYSNVGTPQDAKEKEKHWRFRLMEIEDKLRTYQKSTIHPPSSPESQVSIVTQQPHHVLVYQFHVRCCACVPLLFSTHACTGTICDWNILFWYILRDMKKFTLTHTLTRTHTHARTHTHTHRQTQSLLTYYHTLSWGTRDYFDQFHFVYSCDNLHETFVVTLGYFTLWVIDCQWPLALIYSMLINYW